MNFVKLAWRNVWRNWRRTVIAITAIVLGLILLVFMDAFIRGSDQAIFGNAVRLYGGNIKVHAPGFRERATRLPLIPLADSEQVLATVRQEPTVIAASRRINTGGLVSASGGTYPVTITAIEPDSEISVSLIAANIAQGRFLARGDEDSVVLGQELARLLGVSAGDQVTVLGQRTDGSLRQRKMTVVGVYSLGMADAEKGAVFIPLPEAQTLYNLRNQETEVTVSLDSVGQERALVQDFQADLPGYEVDSFETLRPELRETLQTKSIAVNFIGFVVLMIASIGILNLMLMAVFERTREMGVLSALGLKGRQITTLFVLEGSMIGLVGALVGCLAGWALVAAVARVGIAFPYAEGMGDISALMGDRLYPSTDLGAILTYGLSVVMIAALASIIPAWQASRKQPAESLHYV